MKASKDSRCFEVPDGGIETKMSTELLTVFRMLGLPDKLKLERVEKLGRSRYLAFGRALGRRNVSYDVLKSRLKSWAERSPLVDPEKTMEDEFGERENSRGDYYVGFRCAKGAVQIQNNRTPSISYVQPLREPYFEESLQGHYFVFFGDEEDNELILVNVGDGVFLVKMNGPTDGLFFRRMGLVINRALQTISLRYGQREALRGTAFISNMPEEIQDMIIANV